VLFDAGRIVAQGLARIADQGRHPGEAEVISEREAMLMDVIEHACATLDGLADAKKAGEAMDTRATAKTIAEAIYAGRVLAKQIRKQEEIADTLEPGWNRPAPANVDDVVGVLEDAAERVAMGDSFEGTITWTMATDEPELEDAAFGMVARYRIGNLQGQGGLRVYTKADRGPSA
jgi:hypothetical protein